MQDKMIKLPDKVSCPTWSMNCRVRSVNCMLVSVNSSGLREQCVQPPVSPVHPHLPFFPIMQTERQSNRYYFCICRWLNGGVGPEGSTLGEHSHLKTESKYTMCTFVQSTALIRRLSAELSSPLVAWPATSEHV